MASQNGRNIHDNRASVERVFRYESTTKQVTEIRVFPTPNISNECLHNSFTHYCRRHYGCVLVNRFFDRSLGNNDAKGIEFFVTTHPVLHKEIKSI